MAGKRRRRKPAAVAEMLGPLEAEMMEILWDQGPLLVAEIEGILNQRRDDPLAYKTVLTICARLTEKGYLSYVQEGRAFRYGPTVSRSQFVAQQADKAADAMLNRFGDVALSSFVDQVSADPAQLSALRKLIEE
jgi:predicted transcriptional regulator